MRDIGKLFRGCDSFLRPKKPKVRGKPKDDRKRIEVALLSIGS